MKYDIVYLCMDYFKYVIILMLCFCCKCIINIIYDILLIEFYRNVC